MILKYFQFFLIIFLLTSCIPKEIKEESLGNSPKDLTSQIIFEDCKTYGEFVDSLKVLYCAEEDTIKRLDSLLDNENIHVGYMCVENYACILYPFSRNTVWIYSDSIVAGNVDTLTNLSISEAFRIQYQNNGKNPKLADNPHRVFIRVMLNKEETIQTLQKILEELIIVFKELNSEFEKQELMISTVAKLLPKRYQQSYKKHKIASTLSISFEIPLPPPPPLPIK